ncbi:MAG: HNH endonuclease [Limnothrix sp. CACIAM 69d]|nr:MAG: HNH endonuclease [Limnothrix sp. CACIAM 69d]
MGFSESVSEKALLDCGRSCCLCHKFCGFKIELHHIVQKAEGGPDTYENCIPLCLDCHAEVKAYNPKHPKGRKYTESELRQHRDRWYEKVSHKIFVSGNPDYIELDRKLFRRIREILPSQGGSISFMRKHSYGVPFPSNSHDDLRSYLDQCKDPDFEFINSDLETRKSQLTINIQEFHRVLLYAAYSSDDLPCHLAIEPGMKRFTGGSNYARYLQGVEKAETAATQVCEAYDELIRFGRRNLALD